MKHYSALAAVAFIILLSACAAPRYEGSSVSPAELESKPAVVIIEDEDTREGFLKTIETWLEQNGYEFVVAPEGSKHDLSKLSLEYVGYWNWDLAVYLREARIEAFHAGQRVGDVKYLAPNSLNTNKFSNAEERIGYMLDVLFGQISAADATQAIR